MNTTKVYVLDCNFLQNSDLFFYYYQKMPVYRKHKIDAFRFAKDKRLSLGAGILLGYALKNDGLKEMSYNANGKLYLPNSSLHFNLSHSGSIAMIAVSENHVGCDVELIRPIGILQTAEHFFCDSEYELLKNTVSEQEQIILFYRLWTLKESFMKAIGLGMNLPLNQFCITFSDAIPVVRQAVNQKEYSLKEYQYDTNYCFSVCTEGKTNFEDTIHIVSINAEKVI